MKFFTKPYWKMFVAVTLMVLCYASTFAQTDTVNVRFSNDTVDCAAGLFYVDIEMENPTGSAYTAQSASYRFTYDNTVLGYPYTLSAHPSSPGISLAPADTSLQFNGRTIASAAYFDFGYTITLPANSGWVGIIRLEFPILDDVGCPDLTWVRCSPPHPTGHGVRCTYVFEGNNILDPNEEVYVDNHLLNLQNACLGSFCNLPPDAIDPTDPLNTSDTVAINIDAGDTITLCIPTIDNPMDPVSDDSIVQPIMGVSGTILSYDNDTCFTYIAPPGGTDDFDVYICDGAGGCDTLTFSMIVCDLVAPTIVGAADGDSACYTNSGAFNLSVPTSADYDMYQWYMDGSPIAGATTNMYDVITIGTHDYYVLVWHSSDPSCTVESNTVSLTVHPPVIPGPIIGQ